MRSMLARFAAFIADEPARPSPAPQTQTLAALVSRLDQLSDLRQSESCRAHQAHEASVKASIGAVIEVLDSQIDAIQHASDALIASDPILTEKASLLRSCKGVGPKNAQMILARLPEIGALDRRKIAALVGVAPITCKSGSSINRASIARGRKPLRDTLFMAALRASSHNPTRIAFRNRLKANGKPHKLIIVAVIRHVAVPRRAHALEVVGAHVRIVGYDQSARLQTAFQQAQNLEIQRLGAVEQDEVDRLGEIDA